MAVTKQGLSAFLFTTLFSLANSASNDNTAAAVFVYPTDAGSDFAFALNAASNGDLYFHMSGPSQYSWMAVGIGQDMDDNLMFIAYPGTEDDSITLSPRVAFNGESEPTYYASVHCENVGNNKNQRKRADHTSESSTMRVNVVCHNATSWEGGSLDLSSSSQEFMFAFGPDRHLPSDSFSAPLLRHQTYGNFKMDMTKARSSGSGAVPQPNGSGDSYVQANASDADDVSSDGDYIGIIHGVVACVAYIALFPLGALLLRVTKKMPMRLHWITQSIAFVVVLIGFGLAIAASGEYNRSRDYSDPHQIIGFVTLAAVLVQLVLGAANHIIFKKKGKSTAMGKIHLVVGPIIIILAMVNGGLGLELALATQSSIIAYSVIIAVFGAALIVARLFIQKRMSRNADHRKPYHEASSEDDVQMVDRGRSRGAA